MGLHGRAAPERWQMMADNGRLTRAEARFVGAALGCATIEQAAQVAQVSERSAYRFLARSAVRAELARRSAGVLSQVSARLADAMGEGVEVLREIALDKGVHPGARVSAARGLVDAGLRLAELVALEDRLAAVEAALAERQVAADGVSYRIGGLRAGDI